MNKLHYHFMGLGGISMSGLAWMLLEDGHRVSGCDVAHNALIAKLEARGALFCGNHDAAHVADIDVLVASTAIEATHPEMQAAQQRGVRVLRRVELLGELMAQKNGIGVVGTHGKTTTSSMLASVFYQLHTDPTCQVGGEVRDIGGNMRVGQGPHFIAEIDESDPLFANLKLEMAIVHNVENDHVAHPGAARNNYHASMEDLLGAFRQFAKNTKCVVYNHDWPNLHDLVSAAPRRVGYGVQAGADYRATDLQLGALGSSFTLEQHGRALGTVRVPMPGKHNISNALAVLAVALENTLDFEAASAALANFGGVGRRWEKLGEKNGALVIDDYAHNPSKVAAALEAALASGRRVRAVFQPHRYGRTASEWQRYAEVLAVAHEVLILDIYSAGEAPIAGVHSLQILERMQQRQHPCVRYDASHRTAIEHLAQTLAPNDLVLTLGAGDVYKIGLALLKDGSV